ncbi:hypothetical protein [Mesobacillus zeae]|uniref:C-type cytochrome biogenesis protein CcmI n=1 Tax=Mesobacillus zeae TaxID=1917180 RepID=A0A398B850_9BACI|nr:hypothetical protein [Mesobacillus zeae]RID83893.1 hypothetical protein D1970_14945 [Mesobacillus zeae]
MEEISVISMILTAALALSCLFLILAPLFKKGVSPEKDTGRSEGSATNKEILLTTLNELEFEYKMDKLSEKDYQIVKKQYEIQVAKIMKEEERPAVKNIDKDLLEEVEREIEEAAKKYRNKKGAR